MLILMLAPELGRAQIAVSSNDHKIARVNGTIAPVPNPPPDTADIVDMNVFPPRIVATLNVPGGVSGPPQAVAITPGEAIALVTSSQKSDPATPGRIVPNDVLTIIDLQAKPPVVIATLHTGGQAGGVSINRAGTLALVATRTDGAVAVFSIAGKDVRQIGKVQICSNDCHPATPVFTPDGRTALVTRFNDHKVSILSVDGTKVEYTGRDISANLKPFPMEMSPRSAVAVVSNVGNGLVGGADTLSVIDLTGKLPRVASTVSVAPLPEGLSISPDGEFVAAASMNGSNSPPASPLFNDYGVLQIFRMSGTTLTPVTTARIGHACEGVVWNRKSDMLLVQCAEKELEIFRFDGRMLTSSGALSADAIPTGIRIAQP
jgi:DNA-binding beta-propeller fold protein YncE